MTSPDQPESRRHWPKLASFSNASLYFESAAAFAGLCACYKTLGARWLGSSNGSASGLYIASITFAVVGICWPNARGQSRLLVFALFLFAVALSFFPAALPAVLFSQ